MVVKLKVINWDYFLPELVYKLIANFIIIGCSGCEANDHKKPLELEKKKSLNEFMLFLGFVGLLYSVTIVGNFIKESNVFGDCTYDPNNATYYNSTSMDCFDAYETIRSLSAFDIVQLILGILFVVEEIFKSGQYKNGIAEHIEDIVFTAIALFFLAVAFTVIAVFAVVTINNESDGNQSYRLYLSAFLGAGVTWICMLLFCNISDKHKKGQHDTVQKIMNGFFWIMVLSLFVYIGSMVSVANFIGDHTDFVQCPISTEFSNSTTVFTCLENKDPIKSLCIACLALLAVSFCLILRICHSNSTSKKPNKSKVGKSPTTPEEEIRKKRAEDERKRKEEEERKKREAAEKKRKDKEEAAKKRKAKEEEAMKRQNESNRPELPLHVDYLKRSVISTPHVLIELERQKREANENSLRTPIQGAWGTDTLHNRDTVNRYNYPTIPDNERMEAFVCKDPTEEELSLKKNALYNNHEYWNIEVLPAPPPVEMPRGVGHRPPPPSYDDAINNQEYYKRV